MLLAQASVISAPVPPPVQFAVKGDWGAGTPAQSQVTRRMCAMHARTPFAFVLTTGDNFNAPDGVATQENFYAPERCLREAGIPWHAAWGNHDVVANDTAEVLGAPRTYHVVKGPVLVIVLDANDPGASSQRAFLAQRLEEARQPVRIVVFHQPAYTAGFHRAGEAQQKHWVPLFRKHRVSLVLQGHNHAYERIVRDGITYITTGGGGSTVFPCVRLPAGLRACRPRHHFLQVTASTTSVRVRAIAANGPVIDDVTLPAYPVATGMR